MLCLRLAVRARPLGDTGLPGRTMEVMSRRRGIGAVLVVVVILAIALVSVRGSGKAPSQNFSSFFSALEQGQVVSATVDQDSGHLTYTNTSGQKYSVQGPQLAGDPKTTQIYRSHIKHLKITPANTAVP